MRRALYSPIRFAPLLSVLLAPACFSLPKADVIHVIDDFAEDAGTSHAWDAFTGWTCSAIFNYEPINRDVGPDGGAVTDAGQPPSPDGGPPVSCASGPEADKPHALATTFELAAPTGKVPLGVMVSTDTGSGAVDFTSFNTFRFNATLYSTTYPKDALPPGTQLEVELGCPTMDVVADQIADSLNVGAQVWGNQITLNLADFRVTVIKHLQTDGGAAHPPSESIGACLRAVDSIRFIVVLPIGNDPVAGTLWLDDIEVTTKPK